MKANWKIIKDKGIQRNTLKIKVKKEKTKNQAILYETDTDADVETSPGIKVVFSAPA
jgi:hypothetical protein